MVKTVQCINRCHAACVDPALHHGGLALDQVAQLGGQQRTHHRRAVQKLVGKHLGAIGPLGRQRHLGADVLLQRGTGLGVRRDAVRRQQPIVERAGQHRAVQLLLLPK